MMQRIEILREEYLPAFQRLSRSHDRPIRAACEISYGCKLQSPGDLKEWPVKSHHLLQDKPPLSGSIYWKSDDAPVDLFNKWHQEATEAAKLFGDWVKPLGLDSRIVRPRWPGSWFLLFSKFSGCEAYPFPISVTRTLKTNKDILTGRDSRPLIFQPSQDIQGKPGLCAASSELIFVADLFKATNLAIHCIIEAAESRKPIDRVAGPSHVVCDGCGFQRDCDPYCPPTRCIKCGEPFVNDGRAVDELSVASKRSAATDHRYFSDHRGSGPSYGDPNPSGEHREADPVSAFLAECQKYVNLKQAEGLLSQSIGNQSTVLLSERVQEILDTQSERCKVRNSLQSLADDVAAEVVKVSKDPAPVYAIVLSAEQDASKFFEHWRAVNPLLKTVDLITRSRHENEGGLSLQRSEIERSHDRKRIELELAGNAEQNGGSSKDQNVDALAEMFKAETEGFGDNQWSDKVDRRTKAKAKEGRGRKTRSFFIEGVGGIYYGDDRTYVIRGDEKLGYYSLAATHSERIGKKFATEFSLNRR